MRLRTSTLALAAVAFLAVAGGSAIAQNPSGAGSGQHGVGAGPDPVTTGAQGTPDASQPGMAPAAAAEDEAMPMKKKMKKHGKMSHKKKHTM